MYHEKLRQVARHSLGLKRQRPIPSVAAVRHATGGSMAERTLTQEERLAQLSSDDAGPTRPTALAPLSRPEADLPSDS